MQNFIATFGRLSLKILDMQLRNTLLIFLIIPFLWTCEEPLDINIPREEQQIIVQSNFSENNALRVVVLKTEEFKSDIYSQLVRNALVRVFDGDTFLETLKLISEIDGELIDPYYESENFKPQVGVAYTIEVKVPDFEAVYATSAIPVAADVGEISFSNDSETIQGGLKSVHFEIGVPFDDPIGVENYYHIIFIQELTDYRINPLLDPPNDTIRESTSLIDPENMVIEPANEDVPMIEFTDRRSFLIKDEFFDGDQISIPFSGSFIYNPNKHLLEPFKIEFRTVTRDYYLYHESFAKNSRTGNDPFSGPVVIHNNITGGGGLFSGYHSKIMEFKISN